VLPLLISRVHPNNQTLLHSLIYAKKALVNSTCKQNSLFIHFYKYLDKNKIDLTYILPQHAIRESLTTNVLDDRNKYIEWLAKNQK